MVKKINESTSSEAANSISVIIQGMYTVLSELDSMVEDSANNENKLVKKDVADKIYKLSKSLASIKEIIKGYKPNKEFSRDVLTRRIYNKYTSGPAHVGKRIEEFLLSHGASRDNDDMFEGVSDEDLLTLYNNMKIIVNESTDNDTFLARAAKLNALLENKEAQRELKRYAEKKLPSQFFIETWFDINVFATKIIFNIALQRDDYVEEKYFDILETAIKEFEDIATDVQLDDNCLKLDVTEFFEDPFEL